MNLYKIIGEYEVKNVLAESLEEAIETYQKDHLKKKGKKDSIVSVEWIYKNLLEKENKNV